MPAPPEIVRNVSADDREPPVSLCGDGSVLVPCGPDRVALLAHDPRTGQWPERARYKISHETVYERVEVDPDVPF